ncbi:MAG: helix-turn-helix transcriptional regulator [Bacteroidota bacterium]
MDSVTQLQLDQSLIDSKAQFQLKEQEREKQTLEQQNQLLAQENQMRNAQFLMVIVALAALVFLILYLVFRYRNKNLLHRQELERSEKEIQLREQRLEWEAKVRSLRDQVIQQQKQDLLKQVDKIDKLKEELTKASDSSHKTLEELLLRQLSDPKNRIGLEQFLHQFNAAFPTYFSNLTNQYPVLSNTDLQFCALLRLGLSIKDISGILAIEPKSTCQKKYRIEEKMGITEKGGLERGLFTVGG